MIVWLTNATKKRIIKELSDILYDHPRYRGDSKNVQNKFAFSERPQRGIVVNGVSADRVALSADNYMGRLHSFAMQVPMGKHPNTTVEWVRENNKVVREYDFKMESFPTPPGVYMFKITRMPNVPEKLPGLLELKSVIEVEQEECVVIPVTEFGEVQLSHDGVYPGSVRIYADNRMLLLPEVDFTVDNVNGTITFLRAGAFDSSIKVDYRYNGLTQYDISFMPETIDETIIPGLQIYYGDRTQEDDQWAIVITSTRVEVAKVYGGKFEMSFDIVAFSKDAEDREKLTDYIVMKIMERQLPLGTEGIELLDIAPGGENEDVFNPETDEYYYESNISMRVRVEWGINIPLPVKISRATFVSKVAEQASGYLDGSFVLDNLEVNADRVGVQVGGIYYGERLT